MKKLLYTLLAVTIIFSACKKEEEPTNTNNSGNNTNSNSIVGEWRTELDSYDHHYKIIFYSSGDSYHKPYVGNADYDFNCPYEALDTEYLNFYDYPAWGNRYFKYNVAGNVLTITNLDGSSWEWNGFGSESVFIRQ